MEVNMVRGNRWTILFAVGALAPVGCTESDMVGPETPAFGVAAPGTEVSASVTISLPGQTVIRESGAGNGAGTCGTGGAWTNPSGNPSGPVPHAQCLTVVDAIELTVHFSEIANYVQAKSGNVQLNFGKVMVCDELVCEAGDDRAIHYNANKNSTTGKGILSAIDSNGGIWTIDLSEVTGAGNLINPAGKIVSACSTGHGCWPALLAW
jgi:hypothetical protein